MRIAVIGTGYVGLVTGACLAEIGHTVVCHDSDRTKIDTLQNGGLPIYEPYLKDLVEQNTKAGRLAFLGTLEDAIKMSEVIFICVGTPPLENGEADLSSVEMVSSEIARTSCGYKLVVEKSTVPVETGAWVEKTMRVHGLRKGEFDVASNPEFLREGSAVEDFLHPDRIIIGVQNCKAENILRELYSRIIYADFKCPVHNDCRTNGETVPFVVTDVNSAEIIKHASNSFLSTKISFINMVADICEKTGADIKDVSYGMGLDKRIGSNFLNAGIGFGGFCFPKDLQCFIRIAEKLGVDFRLLREVEKINKERAAIVAEKLKRVLWILKGKTIGIWGLAFKPNTDDIRFAPSLEIIKQLRKEGALIKAFDPQAMERTKKVLSDVLYCADSYEAIKGVDGLVVCTEWDEFKNVDFINIKFMMKRPLILDGRNIYDKEKMIGLGFVYLGIGR